MCVCTCVICDFECDVLVCKITNNKKIGKGEKVKAVAICIRRVPLCATSKGIMALLNQNELNITIMSSVCGQTMFNTYMSGRGTIHTHIHINKGTTHIF